MEYTEFGKALKKILIEKGVRVYDVAKGLGVSSAFVSSVITGKKNVPESWVDSLKKLLSLTEEESVLLSEKASQSKDVYKIDVTNCSQLAKNTVYAFQRNLSDLDEETLQQLNEILNKRGEK